MDSLIIAANFSDSCNNASTYGAALSKQLKIKRIILLNLYEPPITSVVSILSDSSPITMLEERSLEKLNEQKRRLQLLLKDGAISTAEF